MRGPAQCNQYSNLLQPGQSRDRILVGVKVLTLVQGQSWAPPSLLYNGYQDSFPDLGSQDMTLTTHPHLAWRLKKE